MQSIRWQHINDLSEDVLLQILAYLGIYARYLSLEIDDLTFCKHVCRLWDKLISDERLELEWRRLCWLRWGITVKVNGMSFREYYVITSSFDGFNNFAQFAQQELSRMHELRYFTQTYRI